MWTCAPGRSSRSRLEYPSLAGTPPGSTCSAMVRGELPSMTRRRGEGITLRRFDRVDLLGRYGEAKAARQGNWQLRKEFVALSLETAAPADHPRQSRRITTWPISISRSLAAALTVPRSR